MAKLYLSKLGTSCRHYFCRLLAEERRENSARGALVLPNQLLVEEVRKNYHAEAVGIDTLVTRLLNLNGYADFHLLNSRSQEIIVSGLLREIAQHLHYFGGLWEKDGFVKAMASLVRQLARSGGTTDEICAALQALGSREKDAEVTLLYKFYREYLKNKDWYDLEGQYRLALLVLAGDAPVLPYARLYFCDFYAFDALQLEFLEALARHCQVTIGLCYDKNLEGTQRQKIFAASKDSFLALETLCASEGVEIFADEEEPAAPASVPSARGGMLEFLTRSLGRECEPYRLAEAGAAENNYDNDDNKKISVPPADAIEIFSFADKEKEARYALTRVKELLRGGVPASAIVVAARDLKTYSSLRLIADEYGVPLTLARTASLAQQPLAEMLQLCLQAADGGRAGAEAYLALLACPLAHLLLKGDGEKVLAWQSEKFFATRAEVVAKAAEKLEQEDEFLNLLDEYIENLPRSASIAEYAAQLLAWLEKLQLARRLGALCREGKIELEALALTLKAQSEFEKCVRQLRDDYARCGEDGMRIELKRWRKLLTEAARDSALVLARGRADGVLVTEAANLQGLNFAHVFLLGMSEGEFPKAKQENWLYNDGERKILRDLGLNLPNTSLAYAEDAYFFAAAVAAAREHLLLSYVAKDEKTGASPYVAQVRRLFAPAGGEILKITPSPVKQPASPEELAQAKADPAWLREKFGGATLDAAQADGVRKNDARYRGVLADEKILAAISARRSFSASALEVYAACPFRYLGERVWRTDELAAADELLTAQDEGDLLHRTLAEFLQKYVARPGEAGSARLLSLPFAEAQAELEKIFRAVAERARAEGKISASPFWEVEQGFMLQFLRKWLRYEYEDEKNWHFAPAALEWAFGAEGNAPLRLTLADGGSVQLVGRIDRLDSDGGRVFLTDYKRSGGGVASGADLAHGLDIQLPLYLLAAAGYDESLRVAGACYFVLKDGERKSCFTLEEVGNEKIDASAQRNKGAQEILAGASGEEARESFQKFARRLIAGYIENIYAGNFALEARAKCSEYCQLKDICRKELSR